MKLIQSFRKSWIRHAIGTRWLIAVSGGPDSMALLRAAQCLALESSSPVVCGHVDHQLRPDSAADAEWLQEQCFHLGIPFRIARVAIQSEPSGGIEEAARRARYQALTQIAHQENLDAILTGHTADDQAETVLHHLFRGTGLRGLSGIPEARQLDEKLWLWRPLLTVRRQEILTALQEWQQSYRTDSSNASSDFTRNRIRNELVPWLERELNARSVEAVLRLSEQAAETAEWLQATAVDLLKRVRDATESTIVRLRRGLVREAPVIVAREMFVQLWIQQHWPRQAMTQTHWQRLVEVCADDGPAAEQMPGGIDVRRRGELLVVTPPSNLNIPAQNDLGQNTEE